MYKPSAVVPVTVPVEEVEVLLIELSLLPHPINIKDATTLDKSIFVLFFIFSPF
jgi:hypothetical protein